MFLRNLIGYARPKAIVAGLHVRRLLYHYLHLSNIRVNGNEGNEALNDRSLDKLFSNDFQ